MGRIIACSLVVAILLAGCNDAADVYPATVQGKLYSALTLQPLTGAQVQVTTPQGTATGMTDAQGKFSVSVSGSKAGAQVQTDAAGQVPALKSVPVKSGQSTYVELFSMPVGKQVTIDGSQDSAVDGPFGSRIKLAAGSLVDDTGAPVGGSVQVTITPMFGSNPKQMAAMPGQLQTSSQATTPGKTLHPFGSVAISMTSSGHKVNLASGKTADVTIPGAGPSTPASSKFYSYDAASGKWTDEGTGTKVSTPQGDVYKGKVSHFSFWGAGVAVAQTSCLTGCVQGAAAGEAPRVVVQGVTDAFRDETTVDANGCFALDVPVGDDIQVAAFGADGAAKSVVTAPSTPASASDPSTCLDLGTIVLAAVSSQDQACPKGQTMCADGCADLTTDSVDCGACGMVCDQATTGVLGEQCINGQCGCPPSAPDSCNGTCVDQQTDPNNCGGCGSPCTAGQQCVGGTCQTPTCPAGLADVNGQCIDPTSNLYNCGTNPADPTSWVDCTMGQGPPDPLLDLQCVDGMCTCGPDRSPSATTGADYCQSDVPECDDLQTNIDHCGDCATSCGSLSNGACVNGTCQSLDCASLNETYCYGGCVDTTSDPNNCGGCYTYCGLDATCSNSACQCDAGFTDCGVTGYTDCVDTDTDVNNCGMCGMVCATNESCVMGKCTATCAAGEAYCTDISGGTGACTDLTSDPNNCLFCGDVCGPNEVCGANGCTCGPNAQSCDQTAPYCDDLMTSTQHCGACNHACAPGQQCMQGVCTY